MDEERYADRFLERGENHRNGNKEGNQKIIGRNCGNMEVFDGMLLILFVMVYLRMKMKEKVKMEVGGYCMSG